VDVSDSSQAGPDGVAGAAATLQTRVGGAPAEFFPALAGTGCAHAFLLRVGGIDVATDRAAALERLDVAHTQARRELGLGSRGLLTAEQVHGSGVAVISREGALDKLPSAPFPGVDALVTDRADVCLGIYVADCCAVYLVDACGGALGLAHSGKKGTELGVVPATIRAMREAFGSRPGDLIAQLSPCILPPDYEIDFAARIVQQCREAGVERISPPPANTAADPARYYSYRREKGRTGRMLALLAKGSRG
jgi:copper oxidase (laccase) domain-containing protein